MNIKIGRHVVIIKKNENTTCYLVGINDMSVTMIKKLLRGKRRIKFGHLALDPQDAVMAGDTNDPDSDVEEFIESNGTNWRELFDDAVKLMGGLKFAVIFVVKHDEDGKY